jgi:hypothetical protein
MRKKKTGKKDKRSKALGIFHDFGKFLTDIAKLAFGSLVLGTVIRWDIPQETLFVFGVVFSITVALAGIIITRFYEEKLL